MTVLLFFVVGVVVVVLLLLLLLTTDVVGVVLFGFNSIDYKLQILHGFENVS